MDSRAPNNLPHLLLALEDMKCLICGGGELVLTYKCLPAISDNYVCTYYIYYIYITSLPDNNVPTYDRERLVRFVLLIVY